VADTGSVETRRVREIRKETSECEVRVALILTEVYNGDQVLYLQLYRCAEQPCDPGCTPVEIDHVLVFQLSRRALNFLLDGCYQVHP